MSDRESCFIVREGCDSNDGLVCSVGMSHDFLIPVAIRRMSIGLHSVGPRGNCLSG